MADDLDCRLTTERRSDAVTMDCFEAKRLMLTDGTNAKHAAYAVGYESVPQFTREFGRLFGSPPLRHVQSERCRRPRRAYHEGPVAINAIKRCHDRADCETSVVSRNGHESTLAVNAENALIELNGIPRGTMW